MKRFGLLILACATVLVVWEIGRSAPRKTRDGRTRRIIRLHRLEVVDDKGRVRAVLDTAPSGEPFFALYGLDEKPVIGLLCEADGSGTGIVLDADGKASLWSADGVLATKNRQARTALDRLPTAKPSRHKQAPATSYFRQPLKLGQVGKVGLVIVKDVIDRRSALVSAFVWSRDAPPQSDKRSSAMLVGTGKHLVLHRFLRSAPVWLRGISTKGMVTGQRVAIDRTMKVTGTETYKPTRTTVFVLEPE